MIDVIAVVLLAAFAVLLMCLGGFGWFTRAQSRAVRLLAPLLLLVGALFFADKALYFAFTLTLTALVASPLVIACRLLPPDKGPKPQLFSYNTGAVVFLLPTLLVLLGGLIPNAVAQKLFLLLSIGPVLAYVALIWGYYFSADAWLDYVALIAIAQTNRREAADYLRGKTPVLPLLATLLLLALGLGGVIVAPPLALVPLPPIALCTAAVFLPLLACCLVRTRLNAYALPVQRSVGEVLACRQLAAYNARPVPGIVPPEHGGVYVVVIGESQTRDHMSAYGYSRPTTPWLESLKDDAHAVVFTEAHSSCSYTTAAVTYAFTPKNQYNHKPMSPTLIQVARTAGFRTAWLSNQSRSAWFEMPVNDLAHQTDCEAWTFKDDSSFDELLLPQLQALDPSPNMLIVLHLMGSHTTYKARYPSAHHRFGDEDAAANSVDCYDNSILYNDEVMRRVVEHARTMPNFKALLYCADHGEDPEHGTWHDATHFTPTMSRIPMYLCFSPEYEAERPQIVQMLRLCRDAVWTNDLLYNLMLSIMGIGVPERDREPENDLLSGRYFADASRFTTLLGQRALAFTEAKVTERVRLYQAADERMRQQYPRRSGKIWAHQCNSLGKLQTVLPDFAGVEMDLRLYPDGRFNVSHAYQPNVSLPLEALLSLLAQSDCRVWLDCKNLNADNADYALWQLNELLRPYQFDKSRIVVESTNVESLKPFHEYGYYTSFYCYFHFDGSHKNPQRRAEYCAAIRHAADSGYADALSCDMMFLDIVSAIDTPLDLLTWNCGTFWWHYHTEDRYRQLLGNERLKAVLVTVVTPYDR